MPISRSSPYTNSQSQSPLIGLLIPNMRGSYIFLVLLIVGFALPSSAQPIEKRVLVGKAACEDGHSLAEAGDEDATAILLLERCHRAIPSADTRRQMRAVRSRLQASEEALAPVAFSLTPEDAQARLVRLDGANLYKGQLLYSDDEIWLPLGRYEVVVAAEGFEGGRFALHVESDARMLVPIGLRPNDAKTTTEVDMANVRGAELGEVATSADPRPKNFETLLADRYTRAPTPTPVPMPATTSHHGPWPYASAALAATSLGVGVTLHSRSATKAATAAYGTGAFFSGVAAYLFLRGNPGSQPAITIAPRALGTENSLMLLTAGSF